MGLLIALIMFFIIGSILFIAVIFPIWMIVQCINHPNLDGKNKTIWVVVMILIWPLGSLLYAIFASQRRLFQGIAITSLVLFVLVITGMLTILIGDEKRIVQEMPAYEQKVNQSAQQLPPADQAKLTEAVNVLKQEMGVDWKKFVQKYKAIELLSMLEDMQKDNVISSEEYAEWVRLFEMRRVLELRQISRSKINL